MKKKDFKILVGCEESDAVRGRFEKLGFNAYSCDIQENRNKNAKHIQGDILNILNDGWDVLICFPPCNDLTTAGTRWFKQKIEDGSQQRAIEFFMKMVNAPIKHIAIENPVGIMSTKYRKPDQIIHPYFFGDPIQKNTCLWLKNLPKLYHNKTVNLFDNQITHTNKGEFFEWIDKKTGEKKRQSMFHYEARSLKKNERQKTRSKTFDGIAEAMANQWSEYFNNLYKF